MGTMASQITSLTIVYSTVYSGADQRKHQSSASLAFVRGIHRWQENSSHKRPVTWKMFPSDDVIIISNDISNHLIRMYMKVHRRSLTPGVPFTDWHGLTYIPAWIWVTTCPVKHGMKLLIYYQSLKKKWVNFVWNFLQIIAKGAIIKHCFR